MLPPIPPSCAVPRNAYHVEERDGQYVAVLRLTQGQFAVIDLADLPIVGAYLWCAERNNRTYYALSRVRGADGRTITLRLHRLLMSPPAGMQVDHIDFDGLNCRRSNLRVVTPDANRAHQRASVRNTSGYAGVCLVAGRWRAMVGRVYLGYWDTAAEASAAREGYLRAVGRG